MRVGTLSRQIHIPPQVKLFYNTQTVLAIIGRLKWEREFPRMTVPITLFWNWTKNNFLKHTKGWSLIFYLGHRQCSWANQVFLQFNNLCFVDLIVMWIHCHVKNLKLNRCRPICTVFAEYPNNLDYSCPADLMANVFLLQGFPIVPAECCPPPRHTHLHRDNTI